MRAAAAPRPGALATVLLAAALGCSGSDAPRSRPPDGAAGDAPAASAARRDAGPGDATPDAPAGRLDAPPPCPCVEPAPSAPAGRPVLIEWIDLATGRVGVRNTGAKTAPLDRWRLCERPWYRDLPRMRVDPGAAFTVHVYDRGEDTATDVYLGSAWRLSPSGEMALYSERAPEDPDAVRAFVRWGAPAGPTTREHVAAAAGLWERGTFVPVCDPEGGIVAAGEVSGVSGWRSVGRGCLGDR